MQDLPISFVPDIATALGKLYDPLFQWFQTHPSAPVAILCDILLSSWTTKLASHLNIPNISFIPFNAAAVFSWHAKTNIMPSFFKETYTASVKLDMIKEMFTQHDRVRGVGPLLPVKAGTRA
ncbi:hypothetical protein CRYUN_Cryun29cG0016700 [Craigia yunnanensis]